MPEISKESNALFNDIIKCITNINNLSSEDFNRIFDKYNISEYREDLQKFLKSWDGMGDISASYQQWMKANGKSTSAFTTFTKKASTALKSLGAAMASMAVNWAIGEIIALVVKLVDNLAHSAEYCKERVDELMFSYKSALDKANSNANKSY